MNSTYNATAASFQDIMKSLHLEENAQTWRTYWDLSEKTFTKDNLIFLEDEFLSKANEYLKLPAEAMEALLSAAGIIRSNPALCRLAWHCHYLLYNTSDYPNPGPSLKASMSNASGMFNTVILLSGLEKLIKIYDSRNIPYEVRVDTLSDVTIWLKDYYDKYGTWGLEKTSWLMNHFRGNLYRLGRLQFMPSFFYGKLKAYRHKGTEQVIAICEQGRTFRSDGQVNGTNDIFDGKGAWVSEYAADDKIIKGNPILPDSRAVNSQVQLEANEWELVLSDGNPMLDVHIPTGSKLDYELCGESFKKAMEFFPKYFPDKPFKGFTCTSWLLDPQFQDLLSRDSNIVRFQMEFYLYPVMANDFQTFERVFGFKPADLSCAPQNTHLQRSIINHVLSGGSMHHGSMFLLKEDLDWGSMIYQKDIKGDVSCISQ